MIKAEHLTIEYKNLLFNDISFILGNSEKVGLIGLNGTGKTTLLRIISGEETPDKGSIQLVNEKVGYLPQEFSFPEEMLIGEYLEDMVADHYSEMYKVEKVLARMGMQNVDHFQYINLLSPGMQMKLYLAKLLVRESTVLLMDEPTNHLDIDGIIWLENFLKTFEGICILVSHDRAFLNNVINKVFEIDEQKLYIFEGNYDEYLIGKEEFKADRAKRYLLQERKREKLDNLLELALKINKPTMISAARKRMEREVTRHEIDEYAEKKVGDISIAGKVHKTKKILEVKDLSFAYEENHQLLYGLNLEIFGSERIWFYGANGIGKTTLVKLLINKLKPLSGEIKWGENLKWEYFSQDQSHLPMEKKLIDYFVDSTGIDHYSALGVLKNYLFDHELASMKIGKLSPGQRARLSFAIFAMHQYDCLILDEPTNHLDIKTKETIADGLAKFKGAILLVSHDRHFAKSLDPTRILTLNEGKLVEVLSPS